MLESKINHYLNVTNENIEKYLIVMVSNVKNLTNGFNDYSDTSVISEYYSITQYEQISLAIKKIGFELKSYFDEDDFIKDFENGLLRDNYPKRIIVLNSAQKGTAQGRKSLIPAFCSLHNILYSNSNAYVTSFVRNKFHWNSFLAQGNYNVCKNWLYDYRTGWLFNQLPEENTKIICKLNSESSSIGLSQKNIFTFSPEKESFIHDLSKKFRQRVIVQEFIEGREIEVPVISLPNKAFSFDPVGISVSDQKELEDVILDYDIRGNNKFGFYDFKNDDEELSERIKLYVEKVANELEIFGYGRIDFRIRNNGQFYITDIATNPHITKSMSFYYAFKQLGYSYQDVLSTLFGLIIESKRE